MAEHAVPKVLQMPAILAASMLLGAGCAWMRPTTDKPDPTTVASADQTQAAEALRLVRYANQLRSLSDADLDREYRLTEQALQAGRTPSAALRMSLLLTVPRSEYRDEQRAAALLQEVQVGANDTAYRELAQFLLAVLVESSGALAEASQSKNAVLAGAEVTNREMQALRQALLAERTRRGELEQQVEALKKIEQSLNERENVPN
jgi:hypothetical protein